MPGWRSAQLGGYPLVSAAGCDGPRLTATKRVLDYQYHRHGAPTTRADPSPETSSFGGPDRPHPARLTLVEPPTRSREGRLDDQIDLFTPSGLQLDRTPSSRSARGADRDHYRRHHRLGERSGH